MANLDKIKSSYLDYFRKQGKTLNDYELESLNKLIINQHASELGLQNPKIDSVANDNTLYGNLGFLQDYSVEGGIKQFQETPAPSEPPAVSGEQALLDLGATLWHFGESATMTGLSYLTEKVTGGKEFEEQFAYENLSSAGKVGAVLGGTGGFLLGFGKLKAALKAPFSIGKVYKTLGSRKITGEAYEAGWKKLVERGAASESEAKNLVLGVMRSKAGKQSMKAIDNAHEIGRATKDILKAGMAEGLEGILKATGRQMDPRKAKELIETVATNLNKHHVNTIHKLVQKNVTGKLSAPVAKYITNYSAKWADDFIAFGAHGLISTALTSAKDETTWEPWNSLWSTLKFTAFLPMITSIKIPGARPGGEMGLIKDRKIIGALLSKFKNYYSKKNAMEDLGESELNLLVRIFTNNTHFKKTAIYNKLKTSGKLRLEKTESGVFNHPRYGVDEAKNILSKIANDVTPSMMKALYSKELATDFIAAVPRMLTGAIYFNMDMLGSEEGKYLKNIHPEVFWTHLLVGGFLTKHHNSILMQEGKTPHVNEFTKHWATFNKLGLDPSETVKIWTNNLAYSAVWSGLFDKKMTADIESIIKTGVPQTLEAAPEKRKGGVLTDAQIFDKFPVLYKVYNRIYKLLYLSRSATDALEGEVPFDKINVDLKLLDRDTLEKMDAELRKLTLEDGREVTEKTVSDFIDEYKQSIPDTIARQHLLWLTELGEDLGLRTERITDDKDKGDIKKVIVPQVSLEGVTDLVDIGVISDYNQLLNTLVMMMPERVEIRTDPPESTPENRVSVILEKIGVENPGEGKTTRHSEIRDKINKWMVDLKREYMGDEGVHYQHDIYNGVYLTTVQEWSDRQVFRDSYRFFRLHDFKEGSGEQAFFQQLENELLFTNPNYQGQLIAPLIVGSYNVKKPEDDPNWANYGDKKQKKLKALYDRSYENINGSIRTIAELVGFGRQKSNVVKGQASKIEFAVAADLVEKFTQLGFRGVGDSRRQPTIYPIIDYFYKKTFDSIAITPDKRAVYMHGINSGVFELTRGEKHAPVVRIPEEEHFIAQLIDKNIIENTESAKAEASRRYKNMWDVIKLDKAFVEKSADTALLEKTEEKALKDYYELMDFMTKEKIVSSINEYKDMINYASGIGAITSEAERLNDEIFSFIQRLMKPEGLEGFTGTDIQEKSISVLEKLNSLKEEIYDRFTNEQNEIPEGHHKLAQSITKLQADIAKIVEAYDPAVTTTDVQIAQLSPVSDGIGQLVGELKLQDAYIKQAEKHARSLIFAMTSGRGSRSNGLRWGSITKKALIESLNTLKKKIIINPDENKTILEIYEKFEQYGSLELFKEIMLQNRIAWEKTISEQKYIEMKQSVRDELENNILTGAEETLKYSLSHIANEYGKYNAELLDSHGRPNKGLLDELVLAFQIYEKPLVLSSGQGVQVKDINKPVEAINDFLAKIKVGIEGKHALLEDAKRIKAIDKEYQEFIDRRLYPLLKAVLSRRVLPSVKIVEGGAKTRKGDKRGDSSDVQFFLEGPTEKPFSEGGITEFYDSFHKFVDDVYFVYNTARLSQGNKDIDLVRPGWEREVTDAKISPDNVDRETADQLKGEDVSIHSIDGDTMTKDWGRSGQPERPLFIRLTDGANIVIFGNRIENGEVFQAFNSWYKDKIEQIEARREVYKAKKNKVGLSKELKSKYTQLELQQGRIIKELKKLTQDIRQKQGVRGTDAELKFMIRAMYYDKNIPNWDTSYLFMKKLDPKDNKVRIMSMDETRDFQLKFQKYFWQSENAGSFHKSRDSIYEAMDAAKLISNNTIITTSVGTTAKDHSLKTAWDKYVSDGRTLKIASVADEFDEPNNPLTARNVVVRALGYIGDKVQSQTSKDAIKNWADYLSKSKSKKFTSSLDASSINAQGYLSTNAAILVFNGTGHVIGDNIAGAKPVIRWINEGTAEVIIGKTHFIYDKELAEKYLDKNDIDILLPESAAKQLNIDPIQPEWKAMEAEISSQKLTGDAAKDYAGNTANIMRHVYDTFGVDTQRISLGDIYLGASKTFKSATTSYVIGHGMDKEGYSAFKNYMDYDRATLEVSRAADRLFDAYSSAGTAMTIYQELRDIGMVNAHTTNDFVVTALANGMHPAISLIRYNISDAFHQRAILHVTKPKTFNGENPVLRAELRVDEPVFTPNNGDWDAPDYFQQTHLGGRYHSYWSGNRQVHGIKGVEQRSSGDHITKLSFSFRFDPKTGDSRDILVIWDGESNQWKTVDPMNKYEEFKQSPSHLAKIIKKLETLASKVDTKKNATRSRTWNMNDVFQEIEKWKTLSTASRVDISMIMGGQRIPTVLGSSVVIDKVQGFYNREEGHVIGTNSFELASKHQGDFDIDTLFVYNDWNFGMLKSRYKSSGEILDVNAYSSPELKDNFQYNPLQINTNWEDDGARAGVSSVDGLEKKTIAFKKAKMAVGRLQSLAGAMRSLDDIGLSFEFGEGKNKIPLELDFVGNRGLKQRIGNSFQAAVDGLRDIAKPVLQPGFERWALFGHGLEDNLQNKMYNRREEYNEDDYRPLLKNYDKLNETQQTLSRDIVYVVARLYTNANKIFAGIHAAEGQRSLNASEISRIYRQVQEFAKEPNAYIFNKLMRQYGLGRGQKGSSMPPEARELIKLFTGEDTNNMSKWTDTYTALKALVLGKFDPTEKNKLEAFQNYSFKKVVKFPGVGALNGKTFSDASPSLSIINRLGDPNAASYELMNGGFSSNRKAKLIGATGSAVELAERLMQATDAFRFIAGDENVIMTPDGQNIFVDGFLGGESGWGYQLWGRKSFEKKKADDIESRLETIAIIKHVLDDRLSGAIKYRNKLENDRFASVDEVQMARNKVKTIRVALDYVDDRINGIVIREPAGKGSDVRVGQDRDTLEKYFGLKTIDKSRAERPENIVGESGKRFEHVYRVYTSASGKVRYQYVGRVNEKMRLTLTPKAKYVKVKRPFQYDAYDVGMVMEGYSLLRGLGKPTEDGGKGLVPENFRVGFGDREDNLSDFYNDTVVLKRLFSKRESVLKGLPDFHSGKKTITKEYADEDVMAIASFMKKWVFKRQRDLEAVEGLEDEISKVTDMTKSMIMDVAEFLLLPDAIPNHIHKDPSTGVNLPVFKVNNRLAKALFKWLSFNGYNDSIVRDIQQRWSDSYNYMVLNVKPGQREGYYKLLESDAEINEYKRPFFYDLIEGSEPLWMPGARMLIEQKFGKNLNKNHNYILPYDYEYRQVMSTTWSDIVGSADKNAIYNKIFGVCP